MSILPIGKAIPAGKGVGGRNKNTDIWCAKYLFELLFSFPIPIPFQMSDASSKFLFPHSFQLLHAHPICSSVDQLAPKAAEGRTFQRPSMARSEGLLTCVPDGYCRNELVVSLENEAKPTTPSQHQADIPCYGWGRGMDAHLV